MNALLVQTEVLLLRNAQQPILNRSSTDAHRSSSTTLWFSAAVRSCLLSIIKDTNKYIKRCTWQILTTLISSFHQQMVRVLLFSRAKMPNSHRTTRRKSTKHSNRQWEMAMPPTRTTSPMHSRDSVTFALGAITTC